MSRGTELPVVEHDLDQLRELGQEVLRSPAFADAEPGFLAAAGERILQVAVQVLDGLVRAVGGSPAVAWIVVLAGVLVLRGVIWRFTRGATRDRPRSHPPATAAGCTAGAWRSEAEDHAAAGRPAAAVLAWYRASIAGLVEAGALEDVPGRTIRELDAEVGRHAPTVAAQVAAAGDAVDRIWYGHQPAGAAEVAAARAADASVRALQGARRGGRVTVA